MSIRSEFSDEMIARIAVVGEVRSQGRDEVAHQAVHTLPALGGIALSWLTHGLAAQ